MTANAKGPDEAAKGEATHRIPETDMRLGVFDTYGSLRDAYCYNFKQD